MVTFAAAQIPHIEDRCYPPMLSGALYPEGIRIWPEDQLEALVREEGVDEIVLACGSGWGRVVELTRQARAHHRR